jgi:hypothetical protein
MKTRVSSTRWSCLRAAGVALTAVALVVGLVSCGASPKYRLTLSSTSGGSVTSPGEGTFTYTYCTKVGLVATPDTGYRFVKWLGNVGKVADVNAASTTINTMQGNYLITAYFERTDSAQYMLTISSTAGGSVTTPGEGTFTYDAGTVVNLVAAAADGYRFINWSGDVASIANINLALTTVRIDDDCVIRANFEQVSPVTYSLIVSSTSGGSVTTPGQGVSVHGAGAVVDLVASAASSYRFIGWTGDVGTVADADSASTTIIMQGNYSVIANFEPIPPVTYNLALSSTAGGSVTSPGEGLSSYAPGTVVNLMASAADGYRFAGWTGDVVTVTNPASASTTVTLLSNYSIVASFEALPAVQYTLTISSSGCGSVSEPGEGAFTVNAGAVVTLIAAPARRYEFSNWTGDVETIADVNSASTTITVNGNYSITANFVRSRSL